MPQKPYLNTNSRLAKSAMGAERKESSRAYFNTFGLIARGLMTSLIVKRCQVSFKSEQHRFFACKLPLGLVQKRCLRPDKILVNYQELDLFFPYVMFAYGALVTFVLSSEKLMKLAEERMPAAYRQRLVGAQVLANLSLWLGGLWILQNLWLA